MSVVQRYLHHVKTVGYVCSFIFNVILKFIRLMSGR